MRKAILGKCENKGQTDVIVYAGKIWQAQIYQLCIIKASRQTWLAASNLPSLYWSLYICFFTNKLKWTVQHPEITLWLTSETWLEPKICRWFWQLHSAIDSSFVPAESRLIHCFWHRGLEKTLWKYSFALKCSVSRPTVKISLLRSSPLLAVINANTSIFAMHYISKPEFAEINNWVMFIFLADGIKVHLKIFLIVTSVWELL